MKNTEEQRLKALKDYEVLDTDFEESFDEITALASEICDAPITLISLIDEHRQWFKSAQGLDARETPREYAFCNHAIKKDELMEVEDTTEDERFKENPLVQDNPYIRFYAGQPLKTPSGHNIGTLCVIDEKPRKLNGFQKNALRVLSNQVIHQLELRLKVKQLDELNRNLGEVNENLSQKATLVHKQNAQLTDLIREKNDFLRITAHDLKTPINSILGFLNLLKLDEDEFKEEHKEYFDYMETISQNMISLINRFLKSDNFEDEIVSQRFEIVPMVNGMLKAFKNSIQEKQLKLDFSYEDGLVLNSDHLLLYQILENLFSNAIKFTPPGEQIKIELNCNHKKGIEVRVTNTGVGISDEQREKLFKKFSTISNRPTGGESSSGLGLYIVKKMVNKLMGEIICESDGENFVRFIVKVKNAVNTQ